MRYALLLTLVGCIPSFYTDGEGKNTIWEAPENTWPMATPPEGLSGEGFSNGQVLPDLRMFDQFGDDVSVWQFYGDIVLLDVSTMWCAPCQELATDAEETYEDYKDLGFQYVTVLQQDVENNPPTVEDLNEWVEFYELTAPVLSDPEGEVTSGAIQNNQFPAVLLIDRDMKVRKRVNPVTDAAVRAAIEDLL